MRVLVGIAALNDEEGLSVILPQMPKEIAGHKVDILVIDDGSSDKTQEVARKFSCLVLSHPNTMGHGRVRRTTLGFAVNGDYRWVITMDGDGQHLPSYLPKFVQALLDGSECVRASRFHPESQRDYIPPQWFELNKQATDEINRITGWNLTDALCGMMGLPTSIVKEVLPYLKFDDYGYIIEMLLRLRHIFPDIRILEIPHPAIYQGTSKLTGTYSQDLTRRIERFRVHFNQIQEIGNELGLL